MNITLVTPTGGRPEAWELCCRWMAGQAGVEDVIFEWIVIDDCVPRTDTDHWWCPRMTTVRPVPVWEPGDNTQARNLREGLSMIAPDADIVFFIEDDDWYSPHYLRTMIDAFTADPDLEMLGLANAHYYHVGNCSYKIHANDKHSSLCSTVIRASAVPFIFKVLEQAQPVEFIDLLLWQLDRFRKRVITCTQPLVVGMKGLPGRPGIGEGHRRKLPNADPDMTVLRDWLGEDAQWYEGFNAA